MGVGKFPGPWDRTNDLELQFLIRLHLLVSAPCAVEAEELLEEEEEEEDEAGPEADDDDRKVEDGDGFQDDDEAEAEKGEARAKQPRAAPKKSAAQVCLRCRKSPQELQRKNKRKSL